MRIVRKYLMLSVWITVIVASICGPTNVVTIFGSFLGGLGVGWFAMDIYDYYKAVKRATMESREKR